MNYEAGWRTGGVGKFLTSPAVVNQLARAEVTSAMMPPHSQGDVVANLYATILTGGVAGSYSLPSLAKMGELDRPIGLTPFQQATHYQDRVVVITHEKLASLRPGMGTTIAVPFAEPMDNFLNGMYTAYVRVERIQ